MRNLVFVLLMVLGSSMFAQTVLVINKTNLAPIANVEVHSKDPQISAVTNHQGIFEASVFSQATQIRFSHITYQPLTFSFEELKSMNFRVMMTEKSYSVEEIVVSASRFEESRQDVAQPIQVLKTKDVTFMNQSTSADVMQNSGNVLVQKSQQGGGSPIIRGFETNKVLMVVDGVRMNNAIYRGGHLQNIITLDNSILERVEIIYGPGSVVYGSDALGGVMHFYTRDPILSQDTNTLVKVNAFSRYGSAASEFTEHIDVGITGQKFGSLSSITFSEFGDLRQGSHRNPFTPDFGKRDFYVERVNGIDSVFVNKDPDLQKMSGYRQFDVLQKFLFKPNDRIEHVINLQYSTSSDIPRYDRLTQTSGGLPKYAEWYYGPQQRLLAAYSLSMEGKNRAYDNARFIVAYQAIEESRHDRRFNKILLNHRTENLNIGTLNIDFEKLIRRNEIRYGVEGTFNDVKSTAQVENIEDGTFNELDTRYPDGGSTMASLAGYFTHTYEINKQWIVNDGLRLSHVRLHSEFKDTTFFPFPFKEVTQDNTALNGNLGLVYMPCSGWRFTGLVSSGFRAPNVDDLSKVFESVVGSVIVPNPELEPEFTYNVDLSASKMIHNSITMGVDAYYTWYRNAITTKAGLFDGEDSIMYNGQLSRVLMNVNAGKAYIYGLNAQFSADVTNNFSITSTLNYTRGRLETDSVPYPLDHIPPIFGRTSFVLNLKQFKGEFFVAYNGWKRLEDYNMFGEDNFDYATQEGMPSWYTLNLRAAYQISPMIQMQASVENILDRNYRVYASNISAPGRNFILTIRGGF